MRHILHKGTALAVAAVILSGYVLPLVPRAYGAVPAAGAVVVSAPSAAAVGTGLLAAGAAFAAAFPTQTIGVVQARIQATNDEVAALTAMAAASAAMSYSGAKTFLDESEAVVAGSIQALWEGMQAGGTLAAFRAAVPGAMSTAAGYDWLNTESLLDFIRIAGPAEVAGQAVPLVMAGHIRNPLNVSTWVTPAQILNPASLRFDNHIGPTALNAQGLAAIQAWVSGVGLAWANMTMSQSTWEHPIMIRAQSTSLNGVSVHTGDRILLEVRNIGGGHAGTWSAVDASFWNNIGATAANRLIERQVLAAGTALAAARLWPRVLQIPSYLRRHGANAIEWAKRHGRLPTGRVPRWVPPFIAAGIWDFIDDDEDSQRQLREAADRLPDEIAALPTPAKEFASWNTGPMQALLRGMARLLDGLGDIRATVERTVFKAFSPNGQQLQLQLYPRWNGIGDKLKAAAPFGFVALAVAAINGLTVGLGGGAAPSIKTAVAFPLTDYGPEVRLDIVDVLNRTFAEYRWVLEVAVWVLLAGALVRLLSPRVAI